MHSFEFEAEIIHWRGPAPFYFVRIPDAVGREIGAMRKALSYGWGVIPVEAEIGGIVFRTSLFPKEGGYLLPLKDAVRKKLSVPESGVLAVTLTLGKEAG